MCVEAFRFAELEAPGGALKSSLCLERDLLDVSSARLNALLRLHLRPINVVVFHAPIGRIHLGRDLALRCFQRLFLPHLATRPCFRLNNRCTSGASDPVLSY